jgi:uncharacterized protein YjiS (DUF1127 family)
MHSFKIIRFQYVTRSGMIINRSDQCPLCITKQKALAMFAHTTHLSLANRNGGLLRRLFAAMDQHRQRQHLRALDDHMLRDIGLTPAMVRAEAARPFWDAPESWLQRR